MVKSYWLVVVSCWAYLSRFILLLSRVRLQLGPEGFYAKLDHRPKAYEFRATDLMNIIDASRDLSLCSIYGLVGGERDEGGGLIHDSGDEGGGIASVGREEAMNWCEESVYNR